MRQILLAALLQATAIAPEQTRFIVVVEWAKCEARDTATPPKWDCRGLEMYRFRLADGSYRGPFLAVPAPAGFVLDAKWQIQPMR